MNGKVIALLVMAALALAVLTSFLYGAILMVLLSIIHNDAPGVPALGFWASWATAFLVTTVAQAARTQVEIKK